MLITCPYCGERGVGGIHLSAATPPPRPAGREPGASTPGSTTSISATIPRGRHREYWHHSGGCRAWLVVERDTLTHEIVAVDLRRGTGSA